MGACGRLRLAENAKGAGCEGFHASSQRSTTTWTTLHIALTTPNQVHLLQVLHENVLVHPQKMKTGLLKRNVSKPVNDNVENVSGIGPAVTSLAAPQ